MRLLGPAVASGWWPTFQRGTKDVSNNATKRARRASIDRYIAAHRNEPHSRWKREVAQGRL